MMRGAALLLVVVVVAFPLTVLFGPPVTWLAGLALGVGGAGAVALSAPVVTAGGAVALVAYALALLIARPVADPLTALVFGATLVLLLVVVHFAGHVQGAALGPGVLAVQIRHWLAVAAAGLLTGLALTGATTVLAPVLRGSSLPLTVAAGALGALLAVAGLIALIAARE